MTTKPTTLSSFLFNSDQEITISIAKYHKLRAKEILASINEEAKTKTKKDLKYLDQRYYKYKTSELVTLWKKQAFRQRFIKFLRSSENNQRFDPIDLIILKTPTDVHGIHHYTNYIKTWTSQYHQFFDIYHTKQAFDNAKKAFDLFNNLSLSHSNAESLLFLLTNGFITPEFTLTDTGKNLLTTINQLIAKFEEIKKLIKKPSQWHKLIPKKHFDYIYYTNSVYYGDRWFTSRKPGVTLKKFDSWFQSQIDSLIPKIPKVELTKTFQIGHLYQIKDTKEQVTLQKIKYIPRFSDYQQIPRFTCHIASLFSIPTTIFSTVNDTKRIVDFENNLSQA